MAICKSCGREEAESEEYEMNPSIQTFCYPDSINRSDQIIISGFKSKHHHDGIRPNVSFLHRTPHGVAVEWGVDGGALTIFYNTEVFGIRDNMSRVLTHHYIFHSVQWDCSFAAPGNEQLVEKFMKGEYSAIFKVLREWAEAHVKQGDE